MRSIILVDMNSFFASVEQQANPFLRGRVVGVGPPRLARSSGEAGNSTGPTSCLVGTSREAKALGIKNGISLAAARRICPEIIVLRAEPEKYREVCRRLNAIYQDYTDRVEAYSIDESFLELGEARSAFDGSAARIGNRLTSDVNPYAPRRRITINALSIASEIKRRIKQEVGEWLTCSIGVGSNKFLAKLASDMEKPDGLTMIYASQLPEIYKTLKLSDLWGMGQGWTKRLASLGIRTPNELMNYPVANLMAVFGKPGYDIWQRVNGLEIDSILSSPLTGEDVTSYDVTDEGGPSHPSPGATRHPLPQGEREDLKKTQDSFGNSWVLSFRTTDKEKLKPVVLRLAEKAARRMRAEKLSAHGIYLTIRLTSGECLGKSQKLSEPIDTGLEFYTYALRLWAPWVFKTEVMHIACGFTSLAPLISQLELFSPSGGDVACGDREGELNYHLPALRATLPQKGRDNLKKLTFTLDSINNKYGEWTIRSGLITHGQDYAPDSIAFGK